MEERIYNPKFYPDEDLKGKCGIYQIRNLVDNKLYIGSANNLYRRKNHQHLYMLKKEIHYNNKLQEAFNDFGEQNFIFEIIEFVEDEDKLLKIEQYWMDRFNVVNEGYNIQPIAGRICITDEIRKKMSEAKKGKMSGKNNPMYGKRGELNPNFGKINYKIKGKNNPSAQKIICIETKQIFDTIKECSKVMNIDYTSISQCCNKKYKTAGKFHFMKYKEYLEYNK